MIYLTWKFIGRHLLESAQRIARSNELHAEAQKQIQASVALLVALLERARAVKWPTNAPTLPKPIGTMQAQNSTSESKSG
jgi:hypothetical protein